MIRLVVCGWFQLVPPQYNLTHMNVPTYLFSAGKDILADPKVFKITSSELTASIIFKTRLVTMCEVLANISMMTSLFM